MYWFLKPKDNNLKYLSLPNKDTKKIITKFRITDHQLLVEIGKFTKHQEIKEYVTV